MTLIITADTKTLLVVCKYFYKQSLNLKTCLDLNKLWIQLTFFLFNVFLKKTFFKKKVASGAHIWYITWIRGAREKCHADFQQNTHMGFKRHGRVCALEFIGNSQIYRDISIFSRDLRCLGWLVFTPLILISMISNAKLNYC